MKVRSIGLFGIALALLGASIALASLMWHDGEAPGQGLADAEVGDEVTAKGEVRPFFDAQIGTTAWKEVAPTLQNVTFILDTGDDVRVLVTGDILPQFGATIVADGVVAFRGPDPSHPTSTLIVIEASSLREPIVFR